MLEVIVSTPAGHLMDRYGRRAVATPSLALLGIAYLLLPFTGSALTLALVAAVLGVGNGFGNYEDRLRRDDARYILTYDLPSIGYESSRESGLIQGILDHYPRRRVVATFVVDETPGPDRAVLIDKEPDALPAHARD